MRLRRGVARLEDLCSGPGKLTQALGIGLELNGVRPDRGPGRDRPPAASVAGRRRSPRASGSGSPRPPSCRGASPRSAAGSCRGRRCHGRRGSRGRLRRRPWDRGARPDRRRQPPPIPAPPELPPPPVAPPPAPVPPAPPPPPVVPPPPPVVPPPPPAPVVPPPPPVAPVPPPPPVAPVPAPVPAPPPGVPVAPPLPVVPPPVLPPWRRRWARPGSSGACRCSSPLPSPASVAHSWCRSRPCSWSSGAGSRAARIWSA